MRHHNQSTNLVHMSTNTTQQARGAVFQVAGFVHRVQGAARSCPACNSPSGACSQQAGTRHVVNMIFGEGIAHLVIIMSRLSLHGSGQTHE